ncbi:MAG: radical SAM protein [Lachnospiraceae bacterium]|nr:radical SAM protein [Lachnospiraceae bacterium]MCI1308965.1 radical SAM protein [Lachnospiraceae bacterium]MCI1357676.1 radical SAM protein [Lachnospiraceae bacterium]MCI1377620.1 radical SAM protein [Lachnospiraceae bacterium]MCI1453961.1 radical SAM protein [Lachnospiraceae bacterium]
MKNENPAGIRRRSTAGSEPYRSFPSFCRDVYGRRLYRIALDAGMTCPNRDGTLGRGGCAFCAGGSGDFAVAYSGQRMDISDFTWFHGNARPGDFIAYFQAYTSTYAPVSRLRDLFEAALSDPMFAGISVATRPDCLGLAGETGASGAGSSGAVQETSGAGSSGAVQETSGAGGHGFGRETSGGRTPWISGKLRPVWPDGDVVQLLAELKERHPDKFIWVELGLQTADDQTAAFVRRGYPTALYDACAAELIRAGIPVITHVILGLPGESEEEMLETVRHVNGVYERASGENGHILSGCGIKLQLLHYLAGTELGRRYLVFHKESVRKDLAGELKTCSLNWNGEPGLTDEPPAAGHAAGNVTDGDRALRAMTEEEYVRTVADCISVLHPDIVVHRLTGDGNSRILLAPLWSRNKRHVLNSIRHELSSRGIVQGCGRS